MADHLIEEFCRRDHAHAGHSAAESPWGGIIPGSEGQKITIVGDDVGGGARQRQFEKLFIIRITRKRKSDGDLGKVIGKIAQMAEEKIDGFVRNAGIPPGDFIRAQNPLILNYDCAREK